MHLKSSPSSYITMRLKIFSLNGSSRYPLLRERGNKKIEVTDANTYFLLPPFNFWEPLHLAAGLGEHNHKHCRLRKALDLCWASKQEPPSELEKTRAKKIMRPLSCHLLKQNTLGRWVLYLCSFPESFPPFSPLCALHISARAQLLQN